MVRQWRRYEDTQGFDSNKEEVVPKVDDVSLVDGVFDGAFGGDGEEDFVMGEGVVVVRGGGLGGIHGSKRKEEKMIVKMIKMVRMETIYFGGSGLKSQMVEEMVDDVSLVDGDFDGAFGGDREEDFVMGEGAVVSSSLLDMFTKSCLGRMMFSLIFLEGLEEEAWVESMEVKEKRRK
ncbi:hypothetical protein Tco_1295697 [Tanacetum coccineum]